MKWLGRIARFIGYLLLALFALAMLGALLPALPVFGSIGPLLVSPFGSWIVLIGIVGAILGGLRWRGSRRGAPGMVALLFAFAALASAIVGVRQGAVARANGIPIDFAATLLGTGTPARPAPVLADYGNANGQKLQVAIYRPAGMAGRRAPVLVYVHGGGWGAGTVHDRARDMQWFAGRGYLVVSVGYTLSSEQVHPWDIAESQVGCALNWIRANAARLGGDPARVALFGESAGGNLVVNVSYKVAAGRLQPSCPGTMPRIAATIAPYPVLDAVRMYGNDDLIAGQFAPTMTTRYTGGTPARYPDRYTAISSPNQIVRGAPPTLLFPGMADHLLPVAAAYDFAAKAKSAGIDIRVIAVPHAEHSFDQRDGSIGSQIVRTGTVQFLARHGLPPLDPQK